MRSVFVKKIFLGHIVPPEGMMPNPKKVDAVLKLAAPTTLRELRGFLGMVSYYRRFIPDMFTIAEPLTRLT